MNLYDMMPDSVKKKLLRKAYDPEETILFAESDNPYLCFLVEGRAEAYVPGIQGAFSGIHFYEAGGFFGEVEQFYEGRKPVEISAMTPCVVDRLHRDDLFKWMQQDFKVTRFIIKEIAYKLILNSEYIGEVSQLTVRERLLHCIATHDRRGNVAALTKEQLAKETKAPVRSINRAIAECAKQGLLCYEGGQLHILDEEGLRAYLR